MVAAWLPGIVKLKSLFGLIWSTRPRTADKKKKVVLKINTLRGKYQLSHQYSITMHLFYYCLLISKL